MAHISNVDQRTDVPQYFPERNLPIEIVLYIVSLLKFKDAIILKQLNKTWENLLDFKELKMKALVKEKPILLFSYTFPSKIYTSMLERDLVQPRIYNVNENCLFFSEHMFTENHHNAIRKATLDEIRRYENKVIDVTSFESLGCKICCESLKYIIFSDSSDHLIGVEKSTGNCIFKLTTKEISTTCHSLKDNFLKVFIYSEDPLIFVIFFSGGLLSKWKFEGEFISRLCETTLPQCKCPPLKQPEFIGNLLFIHCGREKDNDEDAYLLLSLDNFEMQEISEVHKKIFNFLYLSFNRSHHRMGNNYLVIDHEKNKTKMTSFNLETSQENWSREWNIGIHSVLASDDEYVILSGKKSTLHILQAQKGILGEEIEIKQRLIRVACFDSLLFLVFKDNLQILDLSTGFRVTEWVAAENVKIKDVYYKRSKLYLFLEREDKNFSIEYFQLDQSHYPDVRQVSQPKPRTKEIVAIVLSVLAFLFLAGAIMSYYWGAINLSIGLGVLGGSTGLICLAVKDLNG